MLKSVISLIVAAADNNVIGIDNKMPWHIPDDFKHFKSVTLGKPCIMGRKTFESIIAQLGRPLPGRTSIVISRSGFEHEGAISCTSLQEAIAAAHNEQADEIMIIGGAQIYAQALAQKLVDRIYITRVHQTPQGDAFFPELDTSEWIEASRDERGEYSFITLNRK